MMIRGELRVPQRCGANRDPRIEASQRQDRIRRRKRMNKPHVVPRNHQRLLDRGIVPWHATVLTVPSAAACSVASEGTSKLAVNRQGQAWNVDRLARIDQKAQLIRLAHQVEQWEDPGMTLLDRLERGIPAQMGQGRELKAYTSNRNDCARPPCTR